jgi:hypothetical protein
MRCVHRNPSRLACVACRLSCNPCGAGTWLKEWRRRYFRLIGNKLYFSRDTSDDPHGVIDLKDCLTVKSAEEKTGKGHSFEVATPDQVYFLFADSDTEKDEWIGAIGKAIVRYSNSYTPDDGADDSDEEDDD